MMRTRYNSDLVPRALPLGNVASALARTHFKSALLNGPSSGS
jgi:hypothetical protein